MNSKYDMIVKNDEKIFRIALKGFFLEADAKMFVEEYVEKTKLIDAKSYSMIIDCTKFPVIKAELIDSLAGCYKLYASTGFSKIIFINSDSAIQQSQLKRVAEKVGLKSYFVLSEKEAMGIASGKEVLSACKVGL